MIIDSDVSYENNFLRANIDALTMRSLRANKMSYSSQMLEPELLRKLSLTGVLFIKNEELSKKYPLGVVSEQYILINPKSLTQFFINDKKNLTEVVQKNSAFTEFMAGMLNQSMNKDLNFAPFLKNSELIDAVASVNPAAAQELKDNSFKNMKKISAYIKSGGDLPEMENNNLKNTLENLLKLAQVTTSPELPAQLLKAAHYDVTGKILDFTSEYEAAQDKNSQKLAIKNFVGNVVHDLEFMRGSVALQVWEDISVLKNLDTTPSFGQKLGDKKHEMNNDMKEAIAQEANLLIKADMRTPLISGITGYSLISSDFSESFYLPQKKSTQSVMEPAKITETSTLLEVDLYRGARTFSNKINNLLINSDRDFFSPDDIERYEASKGDTILSRELYRKLQTTSFVLLQSEEFEKSDTIAFTSPQYIALNKNKLNEFVAKDSDTLEILEKKDLKMKEMIIDLLNHSSAKESHKFEHFKQKEFFQLVSEYDKDFAKMLKSEALPDNAFKQVCEYVRQNDTSQLQKAISQMPEKMTETNFISPTHLLQAERLLARSERIIKEILTHFEDDTKLQPHLDHLVDCVTASRGATKLKFFSQLATPTTIKPEDFPGKIVMNKPDDYQLNQDTREKLSAKIVKNELMRDDDITLLISGISGYAQINPDNFNDVLSQARRKERNKLKP